MGILEPGQHPGRGDGMVPRPLPNCCFACESRTIEFHCKVAGCRWMICKKCTAVSSFVPKLTWDGLISTHVWNGDGTFQYTRRVYGGVERLR